MSTKQNQTKIKLSDAARDLKITNQELVTLLEKNLGVSKKPSASLETGEMNYILEYYSQNNQVESFNAYFASKNDKPAPSSEAVKAKPERVKSRKKSAKAEGEEKQSAKQEKTEKQEKQEKKTETNKGRSQEKKHTEKRLKKRQSKSSPKPYPNHRERSSISLHRKSRSPKRAKGKQSSPKSSLRSAKTSSVPLSNVLTVR